MKKFLTKEEAKIFFAFIKERMKISQARYARDLGLHPVTISIQIKKDKVKSDQVVKFCTKLFEPIKFLF
jgi:hypothetical protein